MNTTSVPNQVRLWLSTNPGFHSTADIAKALGLETKQVSGAVSKLVKANRIVREDGKVADPALTEAPAEAAADEPAEPNAEEAVQEPLEDLVGDIPPSSSDYPETPAPKTEEDTLFYEFLDFPGNYSIVMAPFALEIAQAAGVPAKVETFKGKLTRRVHFGGSDMDRTARTVSLIQEEAANAHERLRQWQKDTIEKRRGLTDMQRYVEHREFLAAHGHAVAVEIARDGI